MVRPLQVYRRQIHGGINHRYSEFSDVSRVAGSGLTPADILAAEGDAGAAVDTTQQDLIDAERDLGRRIAGTRQSTSVFGSIDLSDVTSFRPVGNRRYQDINGLSGQEEFEEWWIEGNRLPRVFTQDPPRSRTALRPR